MLRCFPFSNNNYNQSPHIVPAVVITAPCLISPTSRVLYFVRRHSSVIINVIQYTQRGSFHESLDLIAVCPSSRVHELCLDNLEAQSTFNSLHSRAPERSHFKFVFKLEGSATETMYLIFSF